MSTPGVKNHQLASNVARPNLLVNGGFEVWQRGVGAFAANVLTADRWGSQLTGAGSLSVSKDTTHTDNSPACLAITYTAGAGDVTPGIYQTISGGEWLFAQLAGKAITLSMRVRASSAGIRAWGFSNGARVYSAAHPGDGVYHTLTLTFTPALTDVNTYAGIEFTAGTGGTAYIDNAMLVVGSVPVDYVPMHPSDELARCLRYYEIIRGSLFVTATAVSQQWETSIAYAAAKATTPTVTRTSSGNNANMQSGSYPSFNTPDTKAVEYTIVCSATGSCYALNAAATVEANP